MTNRLITLDKAKAKVEKLNHYIDLVENYETDTIEKWIIKQYAITNSVKKILEIADEEGITHEGDQLAHQFAVSVINGKKMDQLHHILRVGYRRKYRSNKRTVW